MNQEQQSIHRDNQAICKDLWLNKKTVTQLHFHMLPCIHTSFHPLPSSSLARLILNQVSPSALAKWSSTDQVPSLFWGSFSSLILVHVSPRDLAKWSSTQPGDRESHIFHWGVLLGWIEFIGPNQMFWHEAFMHKTCGAGLCEPGWSNPLINLDQCIIL